MLHPLRLVVTVRQFRSASFSKPSRYKKTVAVVFVEQFHDVSERLFAGKIEIYFSQVRIGVTDCSSYAVHSKGIIVQCQVAEPGHQHADEEEAQPER